MKQIKVPKSLCEANDYGATFSRAVEIPIPEKMLFISGTASVGSDGKTQHPDDFKEQTYLMFNNITDILLETHLTWHDVVKTVIYIRDIDRDYAQFNKIRKEFYDSMNINPYPASVCVEARLCRSDLLIEMEAIAVK